MKETIENKWKAYHGPIKDELNGDEYIPDAPPMFIRGFQEGYDHALDITNQKLKKALEAVNKLNNTTP